MIFRLDHWPFRRYLNRWYAFEICVMIWQINEVKDQRLKSIAAPDDHGPCISSGSNKNKIKKKNNLVINISKINFTPEANLNLTPDVIRTGKKFRGSWPAWYSPVILSITACLLVDRIKISSLATYLSQN